MNYEGDGVDGSRWVWRLWEGMMKVLVDETARNPSERSSCAAQQSLSAFAGTRLGVTISKM